jgi:hypothetical protein
MRAPPSVPKPRLNLILEIFFLAGAALFDGLKFILLFTDAAVVIPVVGEGVLAIAQLLTYVVSILEFFLIFGGLWLCGAYRGSKNSMNLFLTATVFAIDLIPFIDDLPATTAAVVGIIIKARANDHADRQEYEAKLAKAKSQDQAVVVKMQAEQDASYRADSMRVQALEESRRVATTPRAAANDNNVDEFEIAA